MTNAFKHYARIIQTSFFKKYIMYYVSIMFMQLKKDIFSAYEGLKAPDEKRKAKIEGSLLFEGLEDVLKQYEKILEMKIDYYACNAVERIKTVLEPEQINTFLQATIPFETHKNYAENTGYFITKLIQNSYNAGHNRFKLGTKVLTKRIKDIGWQLKGKEGKPLELLVEGDVGNWCGTEAEYSTISIAGNAGDWCGAMAKYLSLSIEGDVGNDCCKWIEHSFVIIDGNAGHRLGYGAKGTVFKTPNRETFEELKQYVSRDKKNKIYFIHKPNKPQSSLLFRKISLRLCIPLAVC